ncbi:hypothetical protein BZZ01_21090 [Nostocales cyanobacterium HT-58-2]|nr:hypothetical protein BZZ01_21090 [Nostocales cyanobacterium HT-58-2]
MLKAEYEELGTQLFLGMPIVPTIPTILDWNLILCKHPEDSFHLRAAKANTEGISARISFRTVLAPQHFFCELNY